MEGAWERRRRRGCGGVAGARKNWYRNGQRKDWQERGSQKAGLPEGREARTVGESGRGDRLRPPALGGPEEST